MQVLEEDFGRYYCVIANVLGESECSAYLNMKNSASGIGFKIQTLAAFLITSLALTSAVSNLS